MKKLEIVIATNNKHKLEEYKKLFEGYNVDLYSLNDLNIVSDPVETGTSFKENALIKAESIKNMTDKIILSDDSGICIEKLGKNVPGIYSHRYIEQFGGQYNTNLFLTKNYNNSEAHFICQLVIENLTKSPLFFEGYIYGHIGDSIKGENGFGYDPIFVPKNMNKTLAELDENYKNSISHRGNAIKKFINYLKENKLI